MACYGIPCHKSFSYAILIRFYVSFFVCSGNYDEVKNAKRYYLSWRNQEKAWNYNECSVKVIGMSKNRARVIVRRKKSGYSKFMNSDFEVNLMMGFVVLNVQKRETGGHKSVLVFEIEQSNDKAHRDLKNVQIWSDYEHETEDLYSTILQQKNNEVKSKVIESDYLERNNSMIPVIYQPRVDAWENFLREIHVHKETDNSFQITLIFQDEVLRKHGILDGIYRYIRLLRYKRTVDVETFFFKDNGFSLRIFTVEKVTCLKIPFTIKKKLMQNIIFKIKTIQ